MSAWPFERGEMASRIRAHDWAATPLGAALGWSDRLKLMVEQILAAPLVSSLVCGPERILIYNDAAARLYGDRHPGALGQPLQKCFPEGWVTVAPTYARVFAGETVQIRAQALDTRGRGPPNIFDALVVPVREAGGHVAYAHMIGFEIGDRLRTEAALRASEARSRAFVKASADVVYRMGPDWSEMRQLDGQGFLADTVETSEVWMERYIHPDDQTDVRVAIEQAISAKAVFELEHRVRRADGSLGWTLSRAVPILDDRGSIVEWLGTASDVTPRRRADDRLRESEVRQAFLLQLSDALRPLGDAAEIEGAATRLLAERFGVSGANYATLEVENGAEVYVVREDYAAPGRRSLFGRYRLADFPSVTELLRAGTAIVVDEVARDPRLAEGDKASYAANDIASFVMVPLIKSGNLAAILAVHDAEPRAWSLADGSLLAEVAERTWMWAERARAEAALRESEERFSQFATSSSDALWIRNAGTLAMEYVSPAIEPIYGVAPDAILGDVDRWTALIVPEDSATAVDHLEQARRGEAVAHEFRIVRPSDGEQRWIRNIDFPLRDAHGRVQRIGGIAEDVTVTKRATERLEVLVNELQHRARNLLGVVNSVASRTLGQGGSIAAFQSRLQALSRAQGLLSEGGTDTVEVGALVRAELAAHADESSQRISVAGPPVLLTARQVQNFALALHELTTNAVKYGALVDGTGRLAVSWEIAFDRRGRRRLALSWTESGVRIDPGTVTRRGYGTELIQEALAYALQAKVDYHLGPDGVHCRIEMPIS